MRALLLVHQGSRSTPALVHVLREKGFEPFVLSSATFDGGAAFGQMCEGLGVEYHASSSVALTTEEVLDRARALPDCRFCWAIWEGQRYVMARANELLGAPDVAPTAIQLAQDKHLMRRRLAELGMSRLRAFRLHDPELRERLDRGERHIVKPRRGAASLLTRPVTSWPQVQAMVTAFERGPGEHDMMADFYVDNELIAETFFEGRELSVEMVRQGGRTCLAIEHEKTLVFSGDTALERGHTSPAVSLSADEVRSATALVEQTLDAFALGEGCFHVEVRVGPGGECEVIEINPRVGGQLIFDSVLMQTGRSMGEEWLDALCGKPVPVAPAQRRCGSYIEISYPEPGRQVLGLERNPDMPEPTLFTDLLRPGAVTRADREDIAAQAMWRTDLETHREQVARLVGEEYVSYVYAKGLTGRPLFLVLEPTNHVYQVIEAADRKGYDAVVFHTLPMPAAGPYAGSRTSMAQTHLVDSWEDIEACFAQVLKVCDGRPVAGTYAAQELTLELDARVQEHFGLPGKGSAAVRELLNKVNVRRRLTDAGLTKLRYFEQAEAVQLLALGTWPVGDGALFFKPVHGAASAFVKRCRDLDEVRAAIAEWRSFDKRSLPVLGAYLDSEGGEFFLEEEATGELMSVEGYVHNGRYHCLGLCSRAVLERDVAVEMGITFPYEHPRYDDIVHAVARIHEALGVTYGPTHTEIIVPTDGEIELVELNLRFTGADALSAMNAAYGAKFEDQLVALAVGDAPNPPPRRRFASLHFVLPPVGLTRLESFELPSDVELPFVKIIKPPGSDITSTDRQIDWIAAFIVCGDTCEEAFERALDVRRRTLVNGEPLGGNPNNVVIGH
jgi:biotin carboxylase